MNSRKSNVTLSGIHMNAWRQALVDRQTAASLIQSGAWLAIAGDLDALISLPHGNWVGGTIPYFMGPDGGTTSRDLVFVSVLDTFAGLTPVLQLYDVSTLPKICTDAPENGFSLIILPAFSDVHSEFARNAPGYDEMYLKPIVGWVAGVHLDDTKVRRPEVIDGRDGSRHENRAVVLHVPLPDTLSADVSIVNLFEQGPGDVIQFDADGFEASTCLVNGERVVMAAYLQARGHDTRLPLVADYNGASINVSFNSVDAAKGVVSFYGPIFRGVDYRLARPFPGRYEDAFAEASQGMAEAHFSCNCILNYLHGELEGRRTGAAIGPMTFGEVAYQLLNQTMVHMTLSMR
jgi:hypothetical protein